MMNIDRNILYRFFEGSASPEEKTVIKNWMESSDQHKTELMKERRLFDALLLSSPEKKAAGNARFRIWTELAKIAAVVAVVFLGCYAYYQRELSSQDKLFQTMQVPAGQHVSLTLPDGTKVWLNTLSKISYPVSFSRKNRTVILDGEAYFDVVKNEHKPFIVQTTDYQVKVFGTEFNVEAYSGRQEFKTTLVTGKVEVTSVHDPSRSVVLKPKQVAYGSEGKLQVAGEDDFSLLSWKEGVISFKNTSFPDMMKTLEKYFGVHIRIENEEVRRQYYTGKFHLNDQLEYILEVLQNDIPFSCKTENEGQIILIQ